MEKLIKWLDWSLSRFLILLMALMVVTVTWQIFTRFVTLSPSSFTEELARFLLIWIGILGAAWAVRSRAHLGIDILTQKLEGKRKRSVLILVYCLVILFAFFVMIVGGWNLVNITFTLNQISAAMGLKMGYIYLVLPLSGALIIIYSVYYIHLLMNEKVSEITLGSTGKGVD